MPFKVFYKYKEINSYTFDCLKNKYYYFSSPDELNDSNDLRFYIEDWNVKSKLKHKLVSDLTASRNGVFCLTDDPNNERMWNEYAKHSSGICIGYKCIGDGGDDYCLTTFACDVIDLDFGSIDFPPELQEKYGDIFRPIPLYKVSYDRKIEKIKLPSFVAKDDKAKEIVDKSAFCKSKEYEWEKEYRAIIVDGSFAFNNEIDKRKIHYPDIVLDCIIFGKKCTDSTKSTIQELLKSSYKNFNKIILRNV